MPQSPKPPVLVAEPLWLQLARKEVGVKEVPGPRNSESVLDYFSDASHPEVKQDAIPWCAAFVGAMLKRANIKPSGSLMARSYESWGQMLKSPVLGCVAVKRRPGPGYVGHVGFLVGLSSTHAFLLGGNQGDQVCYTGYKLEEFTAFRWPLNIPVVQGPLPKTVAGARNGGSQA